MTENKLTNSRLNLTLFKRFD